MPDVYNSSYTGTQIDTAIGAVINKESSWDGKQDKLTGSQGQVVGFDDDGDAIAMPAPDTGVTTFNGRTGAVTPQSGDYTAPMVGARPDNWMPDADDVGAVPVGRTINGHALSANVTLDAEDVGARPSSWTPSAADVGAMPAVSGGSTGQVLTKTASGQEWADGGMTESEADQRYLKLSGGTMTGDINMTGHSINVGETMTHGIKFGDTGEIAIDSSTSLLIGIRDNNAEPEIATINISAYDYFHTINIEGSYINITGDNKIVISADGTGGLEINGRASFNDTPYLNGVDPVAGQNFVMYYVDSKAPTGQTVTLTSSGWSNNSQTVTVQGVVADSTAQLISIAPADKASATAWGASGVFCSAQGANSLTFVCDTAPTASIAVNIAIWEAQS